MIPIGSELEKLVYSVEGATLVEAYWADEVPISEDLTVSHGSTISGDLWSRYGVLSTP